MGRTGDKGAALESVGPALAIAAVALIALLSVGRVTAVFGDSDEGINGAVWATDARSLRELGPIDSRMGGLRLDGTLYATHPPAIVVETALAETIGGEREWVSRTAAWAGTIVALFLLYRLLRAARLTPLVAGGATAAAATTGMVAIYGSMLDTPVTSFPFGLAVVLVWYRQWRATPGEFAVHPLLIAAVAAMAAAAGWQAVMLVALCTVATGARRFRDRRGALREALPFLIGGAVGLGLSLAWIWWVYGDFSVLVDKYSERSGASGGSESGIVDMVRFQIPWIVQLLGLGLIGLGGCVAALRDATLKPLAAMSLVIVVLYPVVFHQAAGGHQFWNYWLILPTAVGFGYIFGKVARDTGANAGIVVTALCVGIAVVNIGFLPHDARTLIDDGHKVVEEFIAADYPAGQTTAWYVGEPFRPEAWIGYYSGLTPQVIASPAELAALARDHPEDLVIVLGDCVGDEAQEPLCAAIARSGQVRPGLTTARELAARATA